MKRRTIALVLVWTLPSLVFVTVTALVYDAFRLPPPDRLDDSERAATVASLRAALEGKSDVPSQVHRTLAGPLAVTIWHQGRGIIRVDGTGDDLAAATASAAAALRTSRQLAVLTPPDRERARIQVDVVGGRTPLVRGNFLVDTFGVPGLREMLPINSGVDGIGLAAGDRLALLLPHELVSDKLVAAKKPAPSLADLATGVDLDRIQAALVTRAKIIGSVDPEALFRFRTDAFVESATGQREQPPLQLYRGNPPRPPLTKQTLREAAFAGARFLIAHLAPNGRYIYEHDLATGVQTDPASTSYSMPRHAGTTYFLAELYRITKEPWLREPIERAFSHLAELMGNGRCANKLPDGTPFDCVMDRSEKVAALGSTALAVVALAEYQRATGDTRYLPMATKLAAWILWLQRPDGSFRHRYDPMTKQADDEAMDLYYSGEAALALARMYTITKDARYAAAAERALDWLVEWYDFFLGGFLYGEEHWTCIASEAIWPTVAKPKYRDFCHGYGAFLRATQASPGDLPDEDDLAGAYGVTPFLIPYNTPAGSRTEAMISAYLLGKHHGTPDDDVREQIRAALAYAVGQQIRDDSMFAVVGPGLGGMPGSPIDRNVRIDFVQHTCSAMIRASEWIDDP